MLRKHSSTLAGDTHRDMSNSVITKANTGARNRVPRTRPRLIPPAPAPAPAPPRPASFGICYRVQELHDLKGVSALEETF